MNNMKKSDKTSNSQMGYDMGVPADCQTMFSPRNVYNNNTCFKCNKTYINKYNLSKHLLEMHGQKHSSQVSFEEKFQYQISKNGKKMYLKKIPPKQICTICDKVLINNSNLKRHMIAVHKINANDFPSFLLSAHASKQLTTHVDLNTATHKDLVSSIGCELSSETHMAVNNNNTNFKQLNNMQKFQASNYNSYIDNIVSNQQNDEIYFIPDQSNKTQSIPTYNDNTVTLYKAQSLETDIIETYHNVNTDVISGWSKEIQALLENNDNMQITENKFVSDKLNTQIQDTGIDNTLYSQSNQIQISKTYNNEMQVDPYDYTVFDQIDKVQDVQTCNNEMQASRNAFTTFNPTKKDHEMPSYSDNTMTLYNTQTLETSPLHSYGAVGTHVASSWPESVKIIETNNDNMQNVLDNYSSDEMNNQVWPTQIFDYSMLINKNNGTLHNQSNQAQICETYNNKTQIEPHNYTVFDHFNKVHILEVHNNETQVDLDTYAKPEQLNKELTFQMLSDETQSITNNDTMLKQPNNEQIPQSSLNLDTHISVNHTVTSTPNTVLTPGCETNYAMPIDNIMSELTRSDDTCLITPILPNDAQTAQTYSDHVMTTLDTQTSETNNPKTLESMEKSITSKKSSTYVQKKFSYFCQDCNVQFQSKSMLLKHKLSVHKTNQKSPKSDVSKPIRNKRNECIICPTCNKQLRKDYLKKHLKNVHKQEINIITTNDTIFSIEGDTNVKAPRVTTKNIVLDIPTIDLTQNDNSCLVTPIQLNETQTIQTYNDHARTTINTQTLEINNPIKHELKEKSVISNKSCKREQKKLSHICQNCNTQFQSKFMLLKHTREMHNTKQKQLISKVPNQKIDQYNENAICHICSNEVLKINLKAHLKNMHKQKMKINTKSDTIFCVESATNVKAHVTTTNIMSDPPNMDLAQNDTQTVQTFNDHEMTTLDKQTVQTFNNHEMTTLDKQTVQTFNDHEMTTLDKQTVQTFNNHEMTTLNTQTLVTNSPITHEFMEKSAISNKSCKLEQKKFPYLCQDCNVQFKNKSMLLKHTQNMHNTKALDVTHQKLLISEIPKHEIIQNNPKVNCHECGKSVRKNYLKRHLKIHKQNMIITEKSDKTSHYESNVNIETHVTTNDVMSDLPILDLTQNDNTCLVTSSQPNGTQMAEMYSDPTMTTLNTQTLESNNESVEKSVMSDALSTSVEKKLLYFCRDCNVQFQNKSMLLKHTREMHSAKQKPIESEFSKKKIIQTKRNINCHICSKQMRQNYLKIHLKNIHGQKMITPAAKNMSHIESNANIGHCVTTVNDNNIVSDLTHSDGTCLVTSSQPDDTQTAVQAYSDRTDAMDKETGDSIKVKILQSNSNYEMEAAANARTVSDSSCKLQSPPQTSNNNTTIDEWRMNTALDSSNEVQACSAESQVVMSTCNSTVTDQSNEAKLNYTDEMHGAVDNRSVELQNIENLMMLAKVANGDDNWLYDLLSRPFTSPKQSKLTMVWSKCTKHKSCIYSDGTHATFEEIQRELDIEKPEIVAENNNIDLTVLHNADDTNVKSVELLECTAVPNKLNILITRKKVNIPIGKTRIEPSVLTHKKNYCKFCDLSFKTRKLHKEHTEYMHQTLKQAIKCDQCHYMFATEHLYHNHLETVHKNRKSPNECDVCTKVFNDKYELKNHFKDTHGGKPYECSICEIIFIKEANRDQHMVSAHDCFKCDMCYLKFDSQRILDSHKNGHMQTRMFVCDYLSCAHLPFSTKKRLKDHLKLHGD